MDVVRAERITLALVSVDTGVARVRRDRLLLVVRVVQIRVGLASVTDDSEERPDLLVPWFTAPNRSSRRVYPSTLMPWPPFPLLLMSTTNSLPDGSAKAWLFGEFSCVSAM